ncbi:MAG: hypothetical protein KAU12_03875 [Candidatus Omnitrophica bacterium]|nr:hypothetical protein [Candidatus Omnitrophota bacterium]
MRESVRVYVDTSKHFEFSELGIPMEVFRKKRALYDEKDNLHFNTFTLKMVKSSNASGWVDTLLNIK